MIKSVKLLQKQFLDESKELPCTDTFPKRLPDSYEDEEFFQKFSIDAFHECVEQDCSTLCEIFYIPSGNTHSCSDTQVFDKNLLGSFCTTSLRVWLDMLKITILIL